ncbi:hypothetical protein EPUS_06259 [Endocarpon pusillum Z07020]|uniref:RTA1 domain protein n=1 Tax=Endocarpon pusillum (strain Z07020 / HMAS-L-300199) TaxID=1263415 RepID=U1HFE2_ENDPU|nr:uncharacterized protein EPUS_06259 [Endocarpon pusillum Z07020]ERF68815.1 hypothetical protein EPUS_06259 [Endocarpon pusillum Z07020]
MLLGRMVQFFLGNRRVYKIKAKLFTWIFIFLDIVSFLVQAAGALMANDQDAPEIVKQGLHGYMGGIGLQQFIIFIFTSMAIRFQTKVKERERRNLYAGERISMTEYRSPRQARKLLHVIYVVLG